MEWSQFSIEMLSVNNSIIDRSNWDKISEGQKFISRTEWDSLREVKR